MYQIYAGDVELQWWHVIYVLLILSAVFIMTISLVIMKYQDSSKKDILAIPKIILVPAGLGMLLVMGMPWVFAYQIFFSTVVMSSAGAPISACVIAVGFVLFGWFLFVSAATAHFRQKSRC